MDIIGKMENRIRYHDGPLPSILLDSFEAEEMIRLGNVGMHCGCEYTSFPIFKKLKPYSRREHSFGVMSIVYHFTHDIPASLAGAFHDIASPCFSHVIDFLHHDYSKQESTEKGTDEIIRNSIFLQKLLNDAKIEQNRVNDYHLYSIADNDSPKLSADRLEYSLSNIINFGFASKEEAQSFYDNIRVSKNEFGEDELCFSSYDLAKRFGELVLKNSRIYVCNEDRFSMFALSYLIAKAIESGVVDESDLMLTEDCFLRKLQSSPRFEKWWKAFTELDSLEISDQEDSNHFRIPAKLRYIDPYVIDRGRLSSIDPFFASLVDAFLATDFSILLGHPTFFNY